ncbi:MAG: hypothetical protein RL553_96, partial [Planctomycetota bacterium]
QTTEESLLGSEQIKQSSFSVGLQQILHCLIDSLTERRHSARDRTFFLSAVKM